MYNKFLIVSNILLALLFTNCDFSSTKDATEGSATIDTSATSPADGTAQKQPLDTTSSKTYSNERFKEVTVEQVGPHEFKVEGKAQIFEARFGWVVEDGHHELKKGVESADAGAPSWGSFSFTVKAEKERPNSTLHLILFENSPKDDSRIHELPVYLY